MTGDPSGRLRAHPHGHTLRASWAAPGLTPPLPGSNLSEAAVPEGPLLPRWSHIPGGSSGCPDLPPRPLLPAPPSSQPETTLGWLTRRLLSLPPATCRLEHSHLGPRIPPRDSAQPLQFSQAFPLARPLTRAAGSPQH